MSEDRSALLTALVTEHSVQQSIASSTIGEASGRASLYMTSLSSTLIALGFLSGTAGFGPFVGAAFPAVLILGWFTIARLVDTSIQAIVASGTVNAVLAGASVGLAVTSGLDASLTVGVISGIVVAIAAVGAAFRYQQSRFTKAFPGA